MARLTGARLVVTWHEVWGEYWQDYLGWKGGFGRVVERLCARLGDLRVAVSVTTRRRLEGIHPKGEGLPVVVVPNGVDVSAIRETKPAEEKSDVIFVGRLIREKNINLLIEAIALIKVNSPKIKILIVGDGPEKSIIIAKIHNYGLEDNIKLQGFVHTHVDIIRLMKASKVFASLSMREGFGISALEAIMCELPVLTVECQLNAVVDLVQEHNVGTVCAPHPEDVCQGLKNLLFNINKNEFVPDFSELKAIYSWDYIAKNYYDFLDSLVHRQ